MTSAILGSMNYHNLQNFKKFCKVFVVLCVPFAGACSAIGPGSGEPVQVCAKKADASFTANGATEITVSVGDTVHYTWTSVNALPEQSFGNFYSSYTIDSPDICPARPPFTNSIPRQQSTLTGPFDWAETNSNGSLDTVIQECQRGHTYTITYTANGEGCYSCTKNGNGQTVCPMNLAIDPVRRIVIVHVNL